MTSRPLGEAGALLFEPKRHGDARGFFTELWNDARYRDAGIDERFVQLNLSGSAQGVLRGLHYQEPNPQGKLVTCLQGEVFDVVADVRRGSPTFGRWWGETLSFENGRQIYVPPGFAHGFVVRSEFALFAYLVSAYYEPADDRAVRYDDPAVGVVWDAVEPIVSERDANAPLLQDAVLPDYRPANPA